MELKYAICCIRGRNLDKAEAILADLEKEPVRDVEDAVRVLCAKHHLAEIKLKQRSLEAAVNHCNQAMRGRRRTKTIGKSHPDYFLSMRLYALILWAKDEQPRAVQYAKLLPDGHIQRIDGQLKPSCFERILETEFAPSNPVALQVPVTTLAQSSTVAEGASAHIRDSDLMLGFTTGEDRKIPYGHTRDDSASDLQVSQSTSSDLALDHSGADIKQSVSTTWLPRSRSESQALATTPEEQSRRASGSKVIVPSAVGSGQSQKLNSQSTDGIGEQTSVNPQDLQSNPQELEAAQGWLSGFGYKKVRWGQRNEIMFLASKEGNLHAVNLVINCGIKVDACYKSKFGTPLHCAAQNGHSRVCERLIQMGAPIDKKNRSWYTPLDAAANAGALGTYKVILSHIRSKNKDISIIGGNNRLSRISLEGAFNICDYLLEQGVDIDALEPYSHAPPLFAIIMESRENSSYRLQACEYFLKRGASINPTCRGYKDTALHIAARSGDIDVCKLVLAQERAASLVNARAPRGITALMMVSYQDGAEICDLLLANGASVNAVDNTGMTPLMYAATFGASNVCRRLLRCEDISVYAKNTSGKIALIMALENEKKKVYKILQMHNVG